MVAASSALRGARLGLRLQPSQLLARRFSSTPRIANTSTPLKEASTAATNKAPGLVRRVVRITGYTVGSIVFGLTATTAIILAHDALTYREANVDKVPLHPLALAPNRGGPKNLPIVSAYPEDEQDELSKNLAAKERLVIVGGGWAAVGLLKSLDPERYNVTLISPNNYYLFNPLLPSAAVGTVEPRSLIEPLRKLLARVHGHYIQGFATDVVMGEDKPVYQGGQQRLLEVNVISGDDWDGEKLCGGGEPTAERKETRGKSVYVPYDRLIVAVGSVTSTHGVPGLENCFHLKTISDARKIRSHILDNLEVAALPTTTPEERERCSALSCAVVGPREWRRRPRSRT